jgi:hypothetical protein
MRRPAISASVAGQPEGEALISSTRLESADVSKFRSWRPSLQLLILPRRHAGGTHGMGSHRQGVEAAHSQNHPATERQLGHDIAGSKIPKRHFI